MITNLLGMHLRAAAELVKTASRFESEIRLSRDDIVVDAKSIMALLGLEGAQGVEVTVSADGKDEEDALRAVIGLIEAKFNEDE
jgi:phosphocarrier protein